MPHKAPPPPHLHGEPPYLRRKPNSVPPELRPDREIEDTPTMHAERELLGRRKRPLLTGSRHGAALIRAFLTGTLVTGMVWVILAAANIPTTVILPVLAPIWVGSITLLYGVFRR